MGITLCIVAFVVAMLAPGWTPPDTFGSRLAMLRQSLGLNVSEAARLCRLPGATWATWEHGALPRRFEEITMQISLRTACDLAWLRGVGGEPPPPSRQLRFPV